MHTSPDKSATTKFPVYPLLRDRWSPRAFSDVPLEENSVLTMLEAASWAPSASNVQPWRYYYALKGSSGFQKILDCLVPGNAIWAQHAGALILNVAEVINEAGKPNTYALHDCGLANENLLLQALSMDIYCHVMAGFDKEKAITTFALSDALTPVCVIAAGYRGNSENLNESLLQRELAPRHRKELGEIAWGV